MKKTNRVVWIDIVKYLCIMFVMLSHLESKTKVLATFFTPFFLNGFFFASGYVYFHKDNFTQFFIKKVKGLFAPWLFFSLFNILLSQLITFNAHQSLIEEIKWNFLQIRGKGDGLWFIAALFIAFIPFYYFVGLYEKSGKQTKDRILFILVALSLAFISSLYTSYMNPEFFSWGTSALPWHLEYIFVAMFWMFLGYMFRNNYETATDSRVRTPQLLILFVIYMIVIYVPVIAKYEIYNRVCSNLYAYFCAIIGVLTLIYVSKKIVPNKYFLYIGQNTLICFALHGKVYSFLQTVIKKIAGNAYASILNNTIMSSVFAVALTVIMSLILIIPIYIINRWFPFLIGRKNK